MMHGSTQEVVLKIIGAHLTKVGFQNCSFFYYVVFTAILHRGLRNCFFYPLIYFIQFLFGLLFPFSLWTFITLFSLDFYFPFSLWTFISLFSLDFYFPFLFGRLFPFSFWTFISHFNPFSIRFQFYRGHSSWILPSFFSNFGF